MHWGESFITTIKHILMGGETIEKSEWVQDCFISLEKGPSLQNLIFSTLDYLQLPVISPKVLKYQHFAKFSFLKSKNKNVKIQMPPPYSMSLFLLQFVSLPDLDQDWK